MSQRREKPITLVTTSWDDGHPLDLRMAELLASYGVPSTFYVPVAYHKRPVMTKTQLSELVEMRMEVGSHTLTHPILTELQKGEIFRELRESREILEDMLGRPVTSFCYPKGKFNDTARSLIRE